MLDPRQFLVFVIRPTLSFIGLDSPSARALLLGTAIQESGLAYVSQLGDDIPGPGLGLFQMEKATHDWLLDKVLPCWPAIQAKVLSLSSRGWPARHLELVTN